MLHDASVGGRRTQKLIKVRLALGLHFQMQIVRLRICDRFAFLNPPCKASRTPFRSLENANQQTHVSNNLRCDLQEIEKKEVDSDSSSGADDTAHAGDAHKV